MKVKQSLKKLPIALLLLPLAISCRESPSPVASSQEETGSESPAIEVVATFLPMYWFTQAVAGEKARVEILIPPGSEVHEYQAKPADVQAIATADILVKNGLGLEEFLDDTIESADNQDLKQIDASAGIEPLQTVSPVVNSVASSEGENGHEGEHHHEGETEGEHHHHEGGNPHVWLDPVLAKQQVVNVRDGLIAVDPENQSIYEANATAYIQKLDRLDAEFKQRLQQYPNCTFVTFHDAYPYLARRYNLQQKAVVAIPEASLSPQDVQKTVNAVKSYQVKALFGEPGVDNKLLEVLAKDLNLKLYEIDSLEAGAMDPDAYFTAMRENLQTLEQACQ